MEPFTDYRISDDDNDPGSSPKTKRGSRACDRCRKIKSKCEPTDGEQCKNCVAAGTQCTFQGPSFKRGPPKGYIHAIEQRWHQVEALLGAIMAAPRAQGIMNDLRQDAFARDILNRVEAGPYGPHARNMQPRDPRASVYDAIMGYPEPSSSPDERRSRRHSRVSREIVSSQDTLSAIPTPEWQDQLLRRISQSQPSEYTSQFPHISSPTGSTSPITTSFSISGEPARRRIRLDGASSSHSPSRLDNRISYVKEESIFPSSSTSHSDPYREDLEETVSALGHLSMGENQEYRYHGRSAGLHLLAKSDRNDDSQTKENGIWKFHMPRSESLDDVQGNSLVDREHIALPPLHIQDHLVKLYFAYVHPSFPVVHKRHFLIEFEQQKLNAVEGYLPDIPDTPTKGGSLQGMSKLLLLAMFAFASRYSNEDSEDAMYSSTQSEGRGSRAGHIYAINARKVLNRVYQHSKASTCQALLLMGMREFGIGSMEQAWIFTGMAARMAIDLGMNRDADQWKNASGQHLFSPAERQIRKQIWWSCCIADKLSAVWLGRPVIFREGDFDTPQPDSDENEEDELWEPYPPDALVNFTPVQARVLSCFREACKLSFIMSQVMTKIYPVKPVSDIPKRAELEKLESSLHQWYFNLPEHLTYSDTARNHVPLPHILSLHIEYQSAVLLLHRAFLPNSDEPFPSGTPGRELDSLPLKSFDICQGAAAHISTMLTVYNQRYGLDKCPPLLSMYLQSAGIMHVVTLNRRPGNTQGTIGLLQCIDAAKAMERIWPCAYRVRQLLKGANVQLDDLSAYSHTSERPKRSVDEALGPDKHIDVTHREMYRMPVERQQQQHIPQPHSHIAQSLGVPISGFEPSTTYYPGYEWWPQGIAAPVGYSPDVMGYRYDPQAVSSGLPQQALFTFDDGQLSANFVQNVHDPQVHYGTHYHQQGPSHSG
ncbi:Transcriptional Regulatory Element [Abortiporus biennis]